MAQQLTELCVNLIANHYGRAYAQIFATLAEHGRLIAPAIAHHAEIPLRRTKTILMNLHEQQLLLHFSPAEDSPTFFEVHWPNAYNLARRTNIVDLVTQRHGEPAGKLVNHVLQLGDARVGDLADAYKTTPGWKRDSGIDLTADQNVAGGHSNGVAKNGEHRSHHTSSVPDESAFHSTLRALLRTGVLAKVGKRSYMPPSDLQETIENIVIREQFPDGKISGTRKQGEFKQGVSHLKRKWEEDDSYSEYNDIASNATIGRQGAAILRTGNKRAKTNGDASYTNGIDEGNEITVPRLSDDLVVRVNYTRCVLGLRSQQLERLARRHLGGVTAAVYSALLHALEEKCTELGDSRTYENEEDAENALPTVNLSTVHEHLDPSIDLGSSIKGFAPGMIPNGNHKKKPKVNDPLDDDEYAELGIKREPKSDSEDDVGHTVNGFTPYRERNKRTSLIEAHLSLLEEHHTNLCVRTRPGSQEWRVNFAALTDTLIEAEIDSTISARPGGNTALRVIRILRARGRLDEKQVASFAMLRIKDVRSCLTELQFSGFVEAQELPKDTGRQPSRTVYLWYCDTRRVQSILLQSTYKSMTRTLQRVEVERERYLPIITKAERSDVQGQEEKKLGASDKATLRAWKERRERLLVQVSRMDDMVALLRDFSGKDTSLTP